MNGSTTHSTSGAATPTPSLTPPMQNSDGTTAMQPPSRERTFDIDGASDARLSPASKFPLRKKSVLDTGVGKQSQHDEELSPKSLPTKIHKGGIDEIVRGKKRATKEGLDPQFLDHADGKRGSVIRIDGAVDGVDGKKAT